MRRALFGMLAFVPLHTVDAQSQDAALVERLRPSPWRERYSSARIEALRAALIADGLIAPLGR